MERVWGCKQGWIEDSEAPGPDSCGGPHTQQSLKHMLLRSAEQPERQAVCVLRNPKDVLVSFYHFAPRWTMLETPKSFEDFFQKFLDGSDGKPPGQHRSIHCQDLRGEVVKLCAFLGKDLTDEVIDHVVEVSTFKNMNKMIPNANLKDLIETKRYAKETMCRGIAGDWKNFFTVAQNELFVQVFREKMSDLPLTFTMEIKQ
ncbi:amine sulfotransferase-like [Diretmus argenteus]